MRIKLIFLIFFLIKFDLFGQLKIEGIYPSNQYYSGWVTLILSDDTNGSITGYTSFQIVASNGDTITRETGPDYFLPQTSQMSYQLQLVEGIQNLPDSLCGTLIFKHPEFEMNFCLNNIKQTGNPTGNYCDEFEILNVINRGGYLGKQISMLLTTINPNGTNFTGYTSFQLFNQDGDSLMFKTGPNYITPIHNTDTIAYTLELIDDILDDPMQIDTMCFILEMENPDCTVKSCQTVNIKETIGELVKIFPNPTNELINIIGLNRKSDKISISDLNGNNQKFNILNSDVIDISNLQNGIYILSIFSNERILTKRIVKM